MEPGFLTWLVRQAGNHLWQSTAFAGVAFVIAVALKATHARARHWVWLAASVKFLVPFGVLASLGGVIGSWVLPAAPIARIPSTVEQVVQPFALPQEAVPVVAAPAPGGAAFPIAAVLVAIWFIGFAAVLFHWWKRWRHVRAAVRASVPLREGREADALRRLGSDVELVCSAARLEPGTFGILKPALWLPAGIADRLSEAELDAILAHELCHARRRDNLWAALHMGVEAIFWFHPLVWWLGARLIEERERACDEEVVRLGSEPQTYAEGVLKVCEFYLQSPAPCAAGVTGGELMKRIEGIMESRFISELCFWKKALLTALLAAAVACPFLFGAFQGLKFEVISIRRSEPGTPQGVSAKILPNGYRTRGQSMWHTIMLAYSPDSFLHWRNDNLSGAPSWVINELYDIDAKLASDDVKAWQKQGPQHEMLSAMLQDALRERCKLVLHRESKEASFLALMVGKNGARLTKATPGVPYPKGSIPLGAEGGAIAFSGNQRNPTGVRFFQTSMRSLAVFLSGSSPLPVVDKTGLDGEYDFALEKRDEPSISANDPAPASTWDPKGAGLILKSIKMRANKFVIVHIERPSAN